MESRFHSIYFPYFLWNTWIGSYVQWIPESKAHGMEWKNFHIFLWNGDGKNLYSFGAVSQESEKGQLYVLRKAVIETEKWESLFVSSTHVKWQPAPFLAHCTEFNPTQPISNRGPGVSEERGLSIGLFVVFIYNTDSSAHFSRSWFIEYRLISSWEWMGMRIRCTGSGTPAAATFLSSSISMSESSISSSSRHIKGWEEHVSRQHLQEDRFHHHLAT